MVSSGAVGLGYSITKDLLRLHRREALVVQLEAERLGSAVHLRVTVRPVLGAGKVTIKRCSAIRRRPADGCAEGDECSFPDIRFRALGPTPTPTLDGTSVAEWVAVIDATRVLHVHTADKKEREEQAPPVGSLMYAIDGQAQMQIAAVVVMSTGKEVRSNTVLVPPLPPLRERLGEWFQAWREARTRRRQDRPADGQS